ncbi:MAG: hypothetical protein A2636_04325 [Elusimicrobia bacterium RIFCSPHIGHO2_01_FULL_64_10]|nr:MAG: hypothetical protein A2636_04325 [Elusimicrobia bacterium RIFCSPHIGHO2_01_FULL_64_10]
MTEKRQSVIAASEDPAIREMVRSACAAEGFEPILCGSGKEAIESARKEDGSPVRLVILESFLPRTEGADAARALAGLPRTSQAPVLMLIDERAPSLPGTKSAGSGLQSITRVRLTADDYLRKPFQPQEIRSRIHSMTKHFRARNAPHPVTSLPGHPQLEQEIFSRLGRGDTIGLVAMDINHFRPFNDHYGTQKGNEVIRFVKDLIQKFPQAAGPSGFLAHIDGDDFVLLAPVQEAAAVLDKLRAEFRSGIQRFYAKDEVKKGFFHEKDRSDKDQIFPLMSLSTAVIEITHETFAHYGELVSEMDEMLRQSKVGSQEVL